MATLRPRALILALGLLVLAGCGLAQSSQPQALAGVLQIIGRSAPHFSLTDQFGHRVSLSQFRGKVVVLAFIDSRCTTVCPLTSAEMVQAVRQLGAAGRQVQLLAVNANPQATSVADVRAYSQAHGLLYGWQFLTASASTLRLVWKAYGIYVASSHGQVVHTASVFVIGPDGQLTDLLTSTMDEASVSSLATTIATLVSRLLPAHPTVAATATAESGIGSEADASLPLAAGGRVQIGPRRPALYLFFATWLSQFTNLAQALQSQDGYAQLARERGWPQLIAVDESVTEPTPSALPTLLRETRGHLDYLVATDPGGRLAGGLGQSGSPEYVLVVAGKVRWRHVGWLNSAELEGIAASPPFSGP